MLSRSVALVSIAFALPLLVPSTSAASAQRTFVASYGQAANTAFNCSIAKPCRAFSEALSVTTSGGEVIVLDSAGYGSVTITSSVSIVAAPGIHAGVTAFSGKGVYVHGAGISVALKGLKINGQGGDVGIDFDVGAKLVIEDCEVSNFTGIGIHARAPDSQTTIRNAAVRGNAQGIFSHGLVAGFVRVTVTNTLVADNLFEGLIADSNSDTTVQVSVSHSVITGNPTGFLLIAVTGAPASFFLEDNTVTFASIAAFDFNFSSPEGQIFTSGTNAVGYSNGPVIGGGALAPCCKM
jgi:Right handed beta helix region